MSLEASAAPNPMTERFEYATPADTVTTTRSSLNRCLRQNASGKKFPVQLSGDPCATDPTRTQRLVKPEGELYDQGAPFKSRAF
ncbi:hypothetical protein D3C72_1636420 [compost metagenome]